MIDNGEKICELHNEVEKVKADQQRLDHELDFILSQQVGYVRIIVESFGIRVALGFELHYDYICIKIRVALGL